MKKRIDSKTFNIVASVTLMVAIGLAIFGISQTIGRIDSTIVAKTPGAILTNAGVSEDKGVYLSMNYFDRRSDDCINLYSGDKDTLESRQFEWSECEYYGKNIEQGLVEFELNKQGFPVGKAGKLLVNRGMGDLSQWFEAAEGKNKNYVGSLKLDYQNDGAVFSFYQEKFYPLDDVGFSDGDIVNRDGHNHLFTMNSVLPFTALLNGEESFMITADDDTFVFVDDKLVLDMGGIHDAVTGEFAIHDNGEIYTSVDNENFAYSGVTIEKNTEQNIRIFHADRDSNDSVFGMVISGINLNVTDSKLANRQEDGMQVAYDPTDSTYVTPLGETMVTKPDSTRGYVIMVTIESAMVLMFVVLFVVSVRNLVKREK